jgi:hypothetical protein
VVFPKSPKGCAKILCAEPFTDSEYAYFVRNVLEPISFNAAADAAGTGLHIPVSDSYYKRGEQWRLSYKTFTYGTVTYSVISTVPMSDIFKSSNLIANQINMTFAGMITAFVFASVIFFY